jgi:hypothetical protein
MRHIFVDKGGEAQIAEPPASGQNILVVETATAVWSEATYI